MESNILHLQESNTIIPYGIGMKYGLSKQVSVNSAGGTG